MLDTPRQRRCDWDYNSTATIYCPHCTYPVEYELDAPPYADGLCAELTCNHCHKDFHVRAVETIVWDVATTAERLEDDELGMEE